MPKLDTKQTSIAGGAILALVLFLVYLFWFRNPEVILPEDVLVDSTEEVAGQDILILVDKLNSVSIDSSLLQELCLQVLEILLFL